MGRFLCAVSFLLGLLFLPTSSQSQWVRTGDLKGGFVNSFASVGSALFATTWDSGLFRSQDNGATWIDVAPPVLHRWQMFVTSDGSELLLGTTDAGMYTSSDNGTSWIQHDPNLVDYGINKILVFGSRVYVNRGNLGAYWTSDYGLNWNSINSGLPPERAYPNSIFVDCFASRDTDILVGVSYGYIARLAAGDTTWSILLDTVGYEVRSLVVSGTSIFAGTCVSGVFRSTDNGVTWKACNNGLFEPGGGTCAWSMAVSGSNVFAATNEGVFRSANGGESWMSVNANLPPLMTRLVTVHGDDVFAGTVDGLWRRPLSELQCCIGAVGNVNAQGIIDVADLSSLVNYLTGGDYILPCPSAANVNGSGTVDLGDLSTLVSYLTGGGNILPNCP